MVWPPTTHQDVQDAVDKLLNTLGANDLGYDLVLLLGQSNMEGGSSGTTYDTRLDPPDDKVFSFDFSGTYSRRIVQALDPLVHPGGSLGIGPGLTFGRWYAASIPPTRRVLLVPCAVAGTPLVSTTPSTWNSAVRGSLYDQAVAHARRALANAGANSRIVAALWAQGETDSDSAVGQSAYAAALDALIDRLRSDVGNASLPFVIGSMVPEFVHQTGDRQAVNAAHAATPARRAYTSFLQGPGGYVTVDGVHYNADGQRIQGRNLVTALDVARANTTAPPTVLPTITDNSPALVQRDGRPLAAYGAGMFGQALTGGVIGTTAPLTATATVGTLEAWVKTTSTGGYHVAVGIHTGAWLGYDAIGPAGGNTAEVISALGDIGDGAWHHLALTMDGSNSRLWVDGKLARVAADTGDFLTGAGPLSIGGQYFDPTADWTGAVDEVRISSSIRYNAPFNPPTAPFVLDRDTVALYHLNG